MKVARRDVASVRNRGYLGGTPLQKVPPHGALGAAPLAVSKHVRRIERRHVMYRW
jgi:hypothetical protein